MTPAGAASLVALLAALMIGGGTLTATERMEREQARQRTCAQLVREELVKRPLVSKGLVRSADHCRDLARIAPERMPR